MKSDFNRLTTNRLLAGVLTSVLCFSVVACDSDDDDSGGPGSADGGVGQSESDSDAAGTSGPAPGVTPGDSLAEPVIPFDGTWVSNCAQEFQELSVLGISEFQQITLEVAGDVYTRTINAFTDSDCSVAAVPSVAVSEHSLQFPEGEATTTQGTAAFIDVTLETIEIDGIDASVIQQAIGFDTEFTIYVVGPDGRLFFGVPALSADTRPTTVNTDVFFELQ